MGQTPPNLRPLRVLVVEHNADARESLCILIRLWGHACETAANGPTALAVFATFWPDVVLIDIGLPGGMDGYEAVREMRKSPDRSGAVFVAAMGCGRDADVDQSYAEGFVAHLTKPLNLTKLEDMLATTAEERAG